MKGQQRCCKKLGRSIRVQERGWKQRKRTTEGDIEFGEGVQCLSGQLVLLGGVDREKAVCL